MKTFNTIGIGEILWDMLPEGKLLGGAPTNFAYHTQQLGAKASVISAIGQDELGKEITDSVNQKQLNNCIAVVEQPTGTVSVELNNGIPNYTIHENVAWDSIKLNEKAKTALKSADAICFGSLAQRSEISRNAIYEALQLVPEIALKVFDINLRQHFYTKGIIEKSLGYANVFKINDEELLLFAEMVGISGTEQELIKAILSKYDLQLLALTKGAEGSYLVTTTEISYQDTPKVTVADTIGAGDSFTSTMVMGLLNGKPLQQIHREAIAVSAFVCTQKGATPVLPTALVG